jgi:hypothetical protein
MATRIEPGDEYRIWDGDVPKAEKTKKKKKSGSATVTVKVSSGGKGKSKKKKADREEDFAPMPAFDVPEKRYSRADPRYRDEDEGLVVYADDSKCSGGYFAKRKCVKEARAEYAKKNKVLYSTECEMLPTRGARKRCYRKINRGL